MSSYYYFLSNSTNDMEPCLNEEGEEEANLPSCEPNHACESCRKRMLNLSRRIDDYEAFPPQQKQHIKDVLQRQQHKQQQDFSSCHDGDHHKELWKSRIIVILAAILTGSNFILVKILNESMPVGIHSVLRFGLGALFSSPWLFRNRLETSSANIECLLRGAESGTWDGVGYLSQALGLRTVPVAVSSFIVAADIVLIPILDRLTGVSVICRQWAGAFVAMVGVGVLTLFGSSDQPADLQPTPTDMLFTLLQPIGFGVAFWRLGHAMDRFPGQAARLTAAQMQAVFVVALVWGLWEIDDISSIRSLPWNEWLSDPKLVFCIVFAGLGTDLLANFLVNLSRDNLTSLESFLLYSTEQVWAVVFAAIFLGEKIGLAAIYGAILIMVGCVLVSEDIELSFPDDGLYMSRRGCP